MATPLPSTPDEIRLQFNGDGLDYFKIWIANTFLTLMTLGVYSAWAKVRKLRYLYRATELANASFDYHADPIKILKGRIVAVILLGVYSALGMVSEFAQIGMALLVMVFVPMLIVRGRRFHLRNTSYRHIRFDFHGTTAGAAAAYVGLPILASMTLGLLYPYVVMQRAKFLLGQSSIGDNRFAFAARTGAFYRTYFLGLFALAAAFVIGGSMAGGSIYWAEQEETDALAILAIACTAFALALIYLAWTYLQVSVTNLTLSCLRCGEITLRSTLRTLPMFWIGISNAMMVIFSFSLYLPWASIRLARYRIESIYVRAPQGLDAMISSTQDPSSAVSEEISELIGMEVGL